MTLETIDAKLMERCYHSPQNLELLTCDTHEEIICICQANGIPGGCDDATICDPHWEDVEQCINGGTERKDEG